MRDRVVADTGPLVAALNRGDDHHAWAVDCMREIAAPMLTCEAVLAEACFLLRGHPGASDRLLEMLVRGALRVDYSISTDIDRLRERLLKWGDLPMSLADACLVGIAGGLPRCTIWTLDRDFLRYRTRRKRPLRLWMPGGDGQRERG